MTPRDKKILCVAYALAGSIALIYQIVWFHAFVEHFGATGTTFLVILCTFIGSLGAGALASGSVYRWIETHFGGRGLKNYGRTELGVAIAGICLLKITQLAGAALTGDFPYRSVIQNGMTFFVPTYTYQFTKIFSAVLAIGIPCFLMGMTFPYLCSLFPDDTSFPSRLYAANTLGACLSVILVEFFGLEIFGYLGCLSIAAIGNVFIGLWFLYAKQSSEGEPGSAPQLIDLSAPASPTSVFPAVLSGFLCGGLQALAFILLKLTLGPSKASYALLTFFAILGIWLASTIVHRWHPSRKVLVFSVWIGFCWCAGIWFLEPRISQSLVLFGIQQLANVSAYTAAFVTTVFIVGLQIFVPYMLWSMLLPDLCDRLHSKGYLLSRTYGLNTISFLIGIGVFGWGLQYVHFFYAAKVFALVAATGLVIFTIAHTDRPITTRMFVPSLIILAILIPLIPKKLDLRLIGGILNTERIAHDYRSTPQHLFWVRYDNKKSGNTLMFDRHPMSGTAIAPQTYMRAMAHFPLLIHRDPQKALLICFGVGMTADAIRQHDSIQRLDIVDLNRSVFELNVNFKEDNHAVLQDPRVRMIIEDGRQFLRLATDKYDFVTMEPPPPLQLGISRLYSEEFYGAILDRLNPGGIVSQWLPESQLDQRAVDLIASTFVHSFPHTFLFVGCQRELIIVGSNEPFQLTRLLRTPPVAVQADMERLGVRVPQFLRSILRIENGMREIWGTGETISDGFTSLESIQIGPVQSLHPHNEFNKFKPDLAYDLTGVRNYLQNAAPEMAAIVSSFYSDPFSDPATIRIIPAAYFPNSASLIEKRQHELRQ